MADETIVHIGGGSTRQPVSGMIAMSVIEKVGALLMVAFVVLIIAITVVVLTGLWLLPFFVAGGAFGVMMSRRGT